MAYDLDRPLCNPHKDSDQNIVLQNEHVIFAT